jgi:hypothetical protein
MLLQSFAHDFVFAEPWPIWPIKASETRVIPEAFVA